MRVHDVVLAFGPDRRSFMERVANLLRVADLRVLTEEAVLSGDDVAADLRARHEASSLLCVVAASAGSLPQAGTREETRPPGASRRDGSDGFFLPMSFDGTRIPGLPDGTAYVSLRRKSPQATAEVIVRRTGGSPEFKTFRQARLGLWGLSAALAVITLTYVTLILTLPDARDRTFFVAQTPVHFAGAVLFAALAWALDRAPRGVLLTALVVQGLAALALTVMYVVIRADNYILPALAWLVAVPLYRGYRAARRGYLESEGQPVDSPGVRREEAPAP